MDATDAATLRAQYASAGYVILPGLIPPASLPALRAASARAISLARSGAWTHRRTVGKQFPPYDTDADKDAWGVQHVMHPGLGEDAFVKWYTGDEVVRVVRALLECEEEDLQMELFNLLINPERHDFALRWHRDDVKENATEEEERLALAASRYGVQWNTALYDDACLYVVPESHRNVRTAAQRRHSSSPEAPTDPLDMPGALRVHLNAGETVFYNPNILHCATYSRDAERATLHACMGDARGGGARARNVLQHGLEWMREDAFEASLPKGRAQGMWARLVEMERAAGGKKEYSLDG